MKLDEEELIKRKVSDAQNVSVFLNASVDDIFSIIYLLIKQHFCVSGQMT